MSKITFKRIPEEDYTYLGHSLYAYQSKEDEYVYSMVEDLKQIKPEDLIVLVSKRMDIWSFALAEEAGYIDKTKGLVFSDDWGANLYIISYCSFELDEDRYEDFGHISNKNFSGIASSLDFRNDYGVVTNAEVIDVVEDGESEKKLIITYVDGHLEELFRYEDMDRPNLFAWDYDWYTSKLNDVTLNDLYRLTNNLGETYVINATGIPDEIASIPASYKQIIASDLCNIYNEDFPQEPTTAPKITDAYEKGESRHYFEGQNLNAWELKYDLRPTADKYSWIPQPSDSSEPYGYVELEMYDDGDYWTGSGNIIFTTDQLLTALIKRNDGYIEDGDSPVVLPDLSLFDPNALWLCVNVEYYTNEHGTSFWDGFDQVYLLKTEPTFPKDTWYEELGYTSDNLSDFVMFWLRYDEETDQYGYVQTPILDLYVRPNHILSYDRNAQASDYKGIIYYMKDERGNEAPYDFKNLIIPGEEDPDYGTNLNALHSTRAPRAMSIVPTNIGTIYTFTGEDGSDASLNLEAHDNVIKASRVNNTYQLPYNFIINKSNSAMCSNYFGYDASNNVLALENGMYKGGGPEVTALLAEAETPKMRSLSTTNTFDPSEDNELDSTYNFEICHNYIGDGCSDNEIVVRNHIQNIKLDMRVTDTKILEYYYGDVPSTVGLFNLVIHYPGLDINDDSDRLVQKGILRDLTEGNMSTLWYISSQQTYPLDIFGSIAIIADSARPVKVNDVQDYSRDPQVADAVELKTSMYVTSEALNDLNARVESLNQTIQLLQQQLNN